MDSEIQKIISVISCVEVLDPQTVSVAMSLSGEFFVCAAIVLKQDRTYYVAATYVSKTSQHDALSGLLTITLPKFLKFKKETAEQQITSIDSVLSSVETSKSKGN